MPPDPTLARQLVERVWSALASDDASDLAQVLAPDVRWGPGDEPEAGCHSRAEVLAWDAQARARGRRFRLTEVVEGSRAVLVGVKVSGTAAAAEAGGELDRWQVVTLREGRVADISGYEDREAAAARAGVSV